MFQAFQDFGNGFLTRLGEGPCFLTNHGALSWLRISGEDDGTYQWSIEAGGHVFASGDVTVSGGFGCGSSTFHPHPSPGSVLAASLEVSRYGATVWRVPLAFDAATVANGCAVESETPCIP